MTTIAQRVAARNVVGAGKLWEGALKALHAFNQKYEEAKRIDLASEAGQKLLNEFAFRKGADVTAPSFPGNPFHTWMVAAFKHTQEVDDPEGERPMGAMILQVMDGKLDAKVFLHQLDKYADALRAVVNAVAPEHFSYFGFKVVNSEHIGDQLARKTLEGVDYLVALFKKRGLTHLLSQGIKGIYLSTDLGTALGTYQTNSQTIELSTALVDLGVGRFMKWVNEAFLHEFGHYVHMNYISPDARKAWDDGWSEVVDKKDAYEKAFKAVTKSDRDRFFDTLMKAGWEPSRAAKSLDPVSRVKFGVWLRSPLVGDPLITDKQFRLTSSGQYVAAFFRDTHAFMLDHYSVEYNDPDYLSQYQKVDRRMRDKLGLLWDGNFTIAPEVVAELAKADPSMQKTVDEALAKLDIVSEYGKINEKEDFAETFVAFMGAPEKLTPMAKFRMQQALSLSSLHGKPVMHLASPLTQRVAGRFLIQAGYFNPGDVVLFGKYKNHHGKILGFGQDKWGNPTVEIEPIPKGRKENKVFGLYKIWRADVKEKALAEQAKQASSDDFMGDLVYREPENACLTGDPRNCRHDGQGEGRFDERPEGGLPEDALFQKHLEPQEEEDAEGLEDEGPPFMRETSLIGATLVSRTSMDPLAERVAQRHLASTIKWKKTPLNSIKGDSGIYARSEPDGRFLVHVHRWRNGEGRDRKYTLFFSAVDYQTPSGGKHYSNIPIPGRWEGNSVNADKVFAAVEKWAHEHPVPAPGLDPK